VGNGCSKLRYEASQTEKKREKGKKDIKAVAFQVREETPKFRVKGKGIAGKGKGRLRPPPIDTATEYKKGRKGSRRSSCACVEVI